MWLRNEQSVGYLTQPGWNCETARVRPRARLQTGLSGFVQFEGRNVIHVRCPQGLPPASP